MFVAIQLVIQITLNYCVDGSIWHFKFPKVVQAHTLGEVGILGIALLRVYSWTIWPIFIDIGSYLTNKEQKISWHSFFETRCLTYLQVILSMLNVFLASVAFLFRYFCSSWLLVTVISS